MLKEHGNLNIVLELVGLFTNFDIQASCSNECHIQIAREVLDAAAHVIRPGVTTDEIDRVVHEATIAAGTSTI